MYSLNKLKKYSVMMAIVGMVINLFIIPISAEEVVMGWDEEEKVYALQRNVSTAINIYTKNGTKPNATHEQGMVDGVEYDILRVTPNENTILQVDYNETPQRLNKLVDQELINSGYTYVGGINAGYFSNGSYNYGKPVGAVRKNNAWTTWQGEENVPAYGSGFATAYITGTTMTLRYHGWSNGGWHGDDLWQWWTGYRVNAENGISGSFTYYVNGVQQDITNGDHGGINYHTIGRAVTILAQKPNKQYLLITLYGSVSEARITSFLGELGVSNALRLDGGLSTQMVYDDKLVDDVKPELAYTEITEDMIREKANTKGQVTVKVDGLIIRSDASTSSNRIGNVKNGKTYPVYEEKQAGGYTWYRIGSGRWIAGKPEWVTYSEKSSTSTTPTTTQEAPAATTAPTSSNSVQGSVTVNVDGLNIRSTFSTYGSRLGKAENGKTYDVYESYYNQGYTWYRIGDNQWIAGKKEWVSYQSSDTKAQTNVTTPSEGSVIGSVTVRVDGLNIRAKATTQSSRLGKAVNGRTYDVYETASSEGYTWYRIGGNEWIAGAPSWVDYKSK